MELDTSILLWGGIILVASIALTVILLRFAMRLKRHVWNQRQTLNILIEISKKLGVPYDQEMENMQRMNNRDTDEFL